MRTHGRACHWAYAILPEYFESGPANTVSAPDMTQDALDAADHALRLDPGLASARAARAYVRGVRQFDWLGAEADFRSVIDSNPQDATAHQWYGEILSYQRRWPEAEIQFDAALAIDPLSPVMQLMKGFALIYQGKPSPALPYFDEALRIAPGFNFAIQWKTLAFVMLRRFDDAEAMAKIMPDARRELVLAFIAAMRDPSKKDGVAERIAAYGSYEDITIPIMLAMLKRNDLVLDAIERMFSARAPYRAYSYANFMFDPLHSDPRFQALIHQVNLPPATGADGVQAR